MIEAVIAIGSNLGARENNIKKAIESINLLPDTSVCDVSKFYETVPFKVPNKQNNYINCCIKINTEMTAYTILGACLGIEAAMGRKREFRFSSRILDLDLIFYGNEKYNTKGLTLPHPRFKERAFVLIPLGDICNSKMFCDFDFSKEFDIVDKSGIKIIN